MIDEKFWNNRRVFLTGHTGFKGAWLTFWLTKMGAQVTGYALEPPTKPSLFLLCDMASRIRDIRGDIRNLELLQDSVKKSRPEIVIHMAAQPLVRESYKDPVGTYSTNVLGTVHILEAVRNTPGIRAVINVTTDKTYENHQWDWGYRENDRLGGHDPYSNSKACSELITESYRKSFFEPKLYSDKPGTVIATARAGNVIGGGDWAQDRLIPDILNSFEKGQPVEIRNPHAVRPWQHVLESLSGYLLLAQRMHGDRGSSYSGAWNFGPEDRDSRTVAWIVQYMADRWGTGAKWSESHNDHPYEASYLKLDISKARTRLGWFPKMQLEQALDTIVSFYKSDRSQVLNQMNETLKMHLNMKRG